VQQFGRAVETVLRVGLAEEIGELLRHLAEFDAVLRALGAGQAGRDLAQIEPDHLRIMNIARGLRSPRGAGHAEQALGAKVGLEGFDLGLAAAGAAEVVERLVVHREEAHGGAVFGRHVGNRRAVGQRQRGRAFTEELDELAHHLVAAQDFGHGEHQVGGGAAFAQAAGELEAHHVWREEVHRLAQHGGLGLDAAHAPAHHADAVDHGGVAVGAHQGVGVIQAALQVHAARQVFQIHLVHDAKARRHDAKGVKGLHAPFHELVALAVALEFELHVEVQRVLRAVVVDHHRVVHHQVHRHQRLDAFGVLAQALGHAAHRREIGQQRHAGKVLQHHARHSKRDLLRARRARLPLRELRHMFRRHALTVAVPQHALQHDAQRHRQACHPRVLFRQRRQRIETAAFARGGLEGLDRGCERMGVDGAGGHAWLLRESSVETRVILSAACFTVLPVMACRAVVRPPA
jgi:hypothetical protein